jgi:hypothetical protein
MSGVGCWGRGSLRVALGLLGLLLGALARPAGAVEPVRVSAQGVVPITQGTEASLRGRAMEAALREAVYNVALDYVPEDRRVGREEELRAALAAQSVPLVLTYSLEGSPQRSADPDNPSGEVFVLRVAATVDGERLRAILKERGWIASGPARPSLVLRVSALGGLRAAPLLELERYLAKALADRGYVTVNPGLYPSSGAAENGVDVARRVGADVAVDVTVGRRALSPRSSGSVGGALAEVGVRAVRVQDVAELALARFEAPGYNTDPELAFASALEGVRDQVAQGLLTQLDRNVSALESGPTAITVRLAEVTTLLQVEAVQRALVERLGARSVQLALLEPRAAELLVESPLSAGALQERLTSLSFDGFGLEVSGVQSSGVSLRVLPFREEPEPLAPQRRGAAPQIDTPSGNG